MKSKMNILSFELNLGKCSEFFYRRGYYIHELSEAGLVMFKPGTSFTASLKRVPLELAFRLTGDQTEVSLAYGTWVLFDTGDLKKELNRIMKQIETCKNDLA